MACSGDTSFALFASVAKSGAAAARGDAFVARALVVFARALGALARFVGDRFAAVLREVAALRAAGDLRVAMLRSFATTTVDHQTPIATVRQARARNRC